MYCQTIRTVWDISRDDRARIATYSLRTPTDRLKENYSTIDEVNSGSVVYISVKIAIWQSSMYRLCPWLGAYLGLYPQQEEPSVWRTSLIKLTSTTQRVRGYIHGDSSPPKSRRKEQAEEPYLVLKLSSIKTLWWFTLCMTPFIPIQLLLLSNQGKEVNYTMRLIRFSFQTYLKEYCTDTPKNIAQILQRLLHRYSNFFWKLHRYSKDYYTHTPKIIAWIQSYSKDFCMDTPKIIARILQRLLEIAQILQRLLQAYSKDYCMATPKIFARILQRLLHRYSNDYYMHTPKIIAWILQRLLHGYSKDYYTGYSKDYCMLQILLHR